MAKSTSKQVSSLVKRALAKVRSLAKSSSGKLKDRETAKLCAEMLRNVRNGKTESAAKNAASILRQH
jgi:hypothetical protein